MNMVWARGEYQVSTDKERLDLEAVHRYLSQEAYWSPGIPFEVVKRAAENSLAFGIYQGNNQVGYARIISDYATFAYLADVFVLPEHRGKGLGKWLMEVIVSHPDLQGLRRWMLATRDAHGLYTGYGFKPLASPDRWMERHFPDVYNHKL